MDLAMIREHIDRIDGEVLGLLAERMELALRAAKLKTAIQDRAREARVLEHAARFSRHHRHLVGGDFVSALFGGIIEESRRIQERRRPLIGFQGEHGAFGELAARRYDPDLVPIPCAEFEDVFEGVEKGWLDLGIVPVEDASDGAVTAVNDLLVERQLHLRGAVKLEFNHCLLGPPGTKLEDIRVASSHPLALARCRTFLDRHGIEPRPSSDTAGASRMLAGQKPGCEAAIGNELCSLLFGLEVIADRIEDSAFDSIRFLVLTREPGTAQGTSCAFIFPEPDRGPGASELRDIFARAGIAVTRIEACPCPKKPGHAIIFLSAGRPVDWPSIEAVLDRTRRKRGTFRPLGFYNEEVHR